jgi:hypothetical protein
MGIYDAEHLMEFQTTFTERLITPGLITGCSLSESVLLSTLECYYSHSDCFGILMSSAQESYLFFVENPRWFDARPLIHKPAVDRFPPNTPVSTIVKSMMLERWHFASSHERFYKSCAPLHCAYSNRIPTKSFVEVMITLVSMIGGVILSLRLATRSLVALIFFLLAKFHNRREKQQRGNRRLGVLSRD